MEYPRMRLSLLPIRSAPRAPGGRSAGVAINARHPTRKCEINETTVDGRRRKKNERLIQESVKFRILFVIPQFYRSVAVRGGSGRWMPARFLAHVENIGD